jgi:prevent-host-death family protein
MDVSVRELKNHLSEYLRRVEEGQEVTVTSHGRPIARLTPIPPTSRDRAEALRRTLGALSWVRIGEEGKPRGARRPIRTRPDETTLADLVLEERR